MNKVAARDVRVGDFMLLGTAVLPVVAVEKFPRGRVAITIEGVSRLTGEVTRTVLNYHGSATRYVDRRRP